MARASASPDVPADGATAQVGPLYTAYMRATDLALADRNARDHDLDTLAASVAVLGYIEPIVLDDRTEKLVGGHGRLEYLLAAEEAGEDPPPQITVGDDGGWFVPVNRGWASKDDADAERAGLALNGGGGWDGVTLGSILADLAKTPAGLAGVGASIAALATTDGGPLAALAKAKPPAINRRTTRTMRWKWFLVRVPAHRVAEVAPLIATLQGIPEVEVLDTENGGGREAGRAEGRET